MPLFSIQNPWVFTLGILGNVVSFLVYLAPAPTFYRMYKRKSTEGFHSFPYVVSLFSAMLWIDYAVVRSDMLLVTINSIGCFIETIYIVFFIAHAPKKPRIFTLKLVILLNFVGFGLICILTEILVKGAKKIQVLGWICVSLSASVYIAPLSIMVPNVVGFIFGMVQMALYIIYKNLKMKNQEEEQKLPSNVKPNTINTSGIHPVCSLPIDENINYEAKDQENVQDQIELGQKEEDDASHQI
ncbi:hypothetical protein ACH5RR_025271 [Cinchona calisaya]|uniref:Bidirectional sugar transporter SWEET n=1 Tax=Cinchona calisaya TaxID=153742 RepID=A0ABD2Z084_9GENT